MAILGAIVSDLFVACISVMGLASFGAVSYGIMREHK